MKIDCSADQPDAIFIRMVVSLPIAELRQLLRQIQTAVGDQTPSWPLAGFIKTAREQLERVEKHFIGNAEEKS